ncbi:MAG: squalene/phytoene synthase family protein [Candidatus Krumholzibacteriota bacterium]
MMMNRDLLQQPGTELLLNRDDLQVWLNRVSRTFALTIRMLKEPFRTYASAAYLLCRVVDTIEDCETLSTDTKCIYLKEFTDRLGEPRVPGSLAAADLFPAPATWDEQLTLHESGILNLIGSFPGPIRDTIFRYVTEMAEGMVLFLEQKDERGFLQFGSDEQLDKYCYYVAGTVGLMMNELFAAISGTDKSGARDAAVELGIGLQLTNIVKDLRKDRQRNIHYCPAERTPHWPGREPAGYADDPTWEIRCLASATISHLAGGKEYLLNLDSNLKQYKLFCITNYLMAWKTLETCIRNSRRTTGDGGTKISRLNVYFTLLESRGCVASDQFLNWRADQLQRSCTTLVLASDR